MTFHTWWSRTRVWLCSTGLSLPLHFRCKFSSSRLSLYFWQTRHKLRVPIPLSSAFINLPEQLKEFRETLHLCLPVYYKGYYKGNKWTDALGKACWEGVLSFSCCHLLCVVSYPFEVLWIQSFWTFMRFHYIGMIECIICWWWSINPSALFLSQDLGEGWAGKSQSHQLCLGLPLISPHPEATWSLSVISHLTGIQKNKKQKTNRKTYSRDSRILGIVCQGVRIKYHFTILQEESSFENLDKSLTFSRLEFSSL